MPKKSTLKQQSLRRRGIQTRKAKTNLARARAFKERQRERMRQASRAEKEEERSLPNAFLENDIEVSNTKPTELEKGYIHSIVTNLSIPWSAEVTLGFLFTRLEDIELGIKELDIHAVDLIYLSEENSKDSFYSFVIFSTGPTGQLECYCFKADPKDFYAMYPIPMEGNVPAQLSWATLVEGPTTFSKAVTFLKNQPFVKESLVYDEDYANAWHLEQEMIEEAEEKQRQEELKQAKLIFDKIPPDTFLIRIDKTGPSLSALEFLELRSSLHFRYNNFSLEIFYKGSSLDSSFEYYVERSYLPGYGPYNDDEISFIVWKVNPLEYFRPIHVPKYFGWGGEEEEFYAAPPGEIIYQTETNAQLLWYLKTIPGLQEKAKREKQAKITAPPKLEALQLTALEKSIQQLEKKMGRTIPQNMQNVIESFLRRNPVHPAYFTTRNNLSRIRTNLFTNGEVPMNRNLRKIDTNLFS